MVMSRRLHLAGVSCRRFSPGIARVGPLCAAPAWPSRGYPAWERRYVAARPRVAGLARAAGQVAAVPYAAASSLAQHVDFGFPSLVKRTGSKALYKFVFRIGRNLADLARLTVPD